MSSIDFRYSKDGGKNWSDWRKLDMGETGDFVKSLEMHRFGRGRQWVFDIRVTDNVKADLLSASMKIEQSAS